MDQALDVNDEWAGTAASRLKDLPPHIAQNLRQCMDKMIREAVLGQGKNGTPTDIAQPD